MLKIKFFFFSKQIVKLNKSVAFDKRENPPRCLVALFSRFSVQKQNLPERVQNGSRPLENRSHEISNRIAIKIQKRQSNYEFPLNYTAGLDAFITGDFSALLIFCAPSLFFYCRMFQKVDWPNPLSSSSPFHPLFYPPSSSHFRVTHTHTRTQLQPVWSSIRRKGHLPGASCFFFSSLHQTLSISPTHLFRLSLTQCLFFFSFQILSHWVVRPRRHTMVTCEAEAHAHKRGIAVCLSPCRRIQILSHSWHWVAGGKVKKNKKHYIWLVWWWEERNERVPVKK